MCCPEPAWLNANLETGPGSHPRVLKPEIKALFLKTFPRSEFNFLGERDIKRYQKITILETFSVLWYGKKSEISSWENKCKKNWRTSTFLNRLLISVNVSQNYRVEIGGKVTVRGWVNFKWSDLPRPLKSLFRNVISTESYRTRMGIKISATQMEAFELVTFINFFKNNKSCDLIL